MSNLPARETRSPPQLKSVGPQVAYNSRMSRISAVKPYRWLARYYDEFFSPARLPLDEAREHILGRILTRAESACDLACGTGDTALKLASRGMKTYAVDASADMCRLAREKAARAGLPVRVIRADMRAFRLPEPVDLITCEGDALNHIPRSADLSKVAHAVERALRPGGHFFFDVNNSLGFSRYWTGVVWLERPGVVLVMRNGHNDQASRAWSDVEWFIRDGSCWRRRHERVQEVCWDSGEVRRVFQAAGFDRIRAWDAARFFRSDFIQSSTGTGRPSKLKPTIGPGCRTFYVARKRSA